MKEHSENFDFLRSVCCIMIIVLHVAAWNYGEYNIGSSIDENFWGETFFAMITRTAVPSFMMMTGAFTLSNYKNRRAVYYYKKVFKSTVLPTLIFSVIYTIYTVFIKVITAKLGIMDAFLDSMVLWFKGDPFGHMWYMYMLIGFYCMAPYMCRLLSKLSDNMRFGIGVLLIIIDCLIGEFIDPVWPLKFLLYIGYFVLGDAIYRKFQYNKNRYLCYGTFILSFLLSLLGVFVVYGTLTKGEELWGALWKLNRHERLSPIVIVSSIALFVAVANSNIKCKKFFSNISKNSFYIYLIHGGVVSVLGNAWNLIIGKPLGSPWIVVPIYSLIVLGISYLGARLFITIWNRSCIKNGGKNEP